MSRVQFHRRDHIVLSIWTEAAAASDVDALHTHARGAVDASGHPVGLVLVVLESVGPSGRPARERAVEMLRELGRDVAFVAIAIVGEGFRVAAIRAMFTGLAFVVKPSFPWRIVADAPQLKRWSAMEDEADAIAWIDRTVREFRATIAEAG